MSKADADFASDVIKRKLIRKAAFDRISKAIKPQKRKRNKNTRGGEPTYILEKRQKLKQHKYVLGMNKIKVWWKFQQMR